MMDYLTFLEQQFEMEELLVGWKVYFNGFNSGLGEIVDADPMMDCYTIRLSSGTLVKCEREELTVL